MVGEIDGNDYNFAILGRKNFSRDKRYVVQTIQQVVEVIVV